MPGQSTPSQSAELLAEGGGHPPAQSPAQSPDQAPGPTLEPLRAVWRSTVGPVSKPSRGRHAVLEGRGRRAGERPVRSRSGQTVAGSTRARPTSRPARAEPPTCDLRAGSQAETAVRWRRARANQGWRSQAWMESAARRGAEKEQPLGILPKPSPRIRHVDESGSKRTAAVETPRSAPPPPLTNPSAFTERNHPGNPCEERDAVGGPRPAPAGNGPGESGRHRATHQTTASLRGRPGGRGIR